MRDSGDTALIVARHFAEALDRDDFVATEDSLATDCVYESPNGEVEGAAAIVATYRRNAEWAAATFEAIDYASEVEVIGHRQVRITYIDRTRHRGRSHEYRCRQIVDVGEEGLIVRIRHEEIPGQREALEAYFKVVGVSYDP